MIFGERVVHRGGGPRELEFGRKDTLDEVVKYFMEYIRTIQAHLDNEYSCLRKLVPSVACNISHLAKS